MDISSLLFTMQTGIDLQGEGEGGTGHYIIIKLANNYTLRFRNQVAGLSVGSLALSFLHAAHSYSNPYQREPNLLPRHDLPTLIEPYQGMSGFET